MTNNANDNNKEQIQEKIGNKYLANFPERVSKYSGIWRKPNKDNIENSFLNPHQKGSERYPLYRVN